MAKHDEMTRYAFISHMEDYMKKLLTDPFKADTDEFLKGHGIDGPKALKILTTKSDPGDENSSVVIKQTAIKDNGYDDNGKRKQDTFSVKYKIPRKDYTKKMRNLYISLFERHLTDNPLLEEGAWGYGILDNDSALDYQSETTKSYLLKVMKDIKNSNDSQSKWAKVGVLVDFLKKYKSDELQVTDEYSIAVDFAKDTLRDLFNDEEFLSSWDDENKIKSSLKKAFNDVSLLRYNEDIMISDKDDKYFDRGQVVQDNGPVRGDGRLMEDLNYYERPLSSTPSPFKSGEKVVSLCPPGSTGDRWAKGVNDNEKGYEPKLLDDYLNEEDGATSAADSGQYDAVAFPMVRKKTMYITQEQANFIKKMLNEDEGMEGMGGATTTQTTGDYQYTVPFGGKKKNQDPFYKEANDHQNIMAKSWQGSVDEEKSGIHIKEKNKGKFNATKARTGKSTEELTHSKNPVTRKRAIFAQNAAKWNKK